MYLLSFQAAVRHVLIVAHIDVQRIKLSTCRECVVHDTCNFAFSRRKKCAAFELVHKHNIIKMIMSFSRPTLWFVFTCEDIPKK